MLKADAALQELLMPLLDRDLVEVFADEVYMERLRSAAAVLVAPDAEVVLRAARGGAVLGPFRGWDGMVAGWREWLSAFESYRISIEGIRTFGDRVVALVRQTGRTTHGGVDVASSPSAAVATVRDGQIVRMSFYLDRDDAAAAEELDLS